MEKPVVHYCVEIVSWMYQADGSKPWAMSRVHRYDTWEELETELENFQPKGPFETHVLKVWAASNKVMIPSYPEE